MMISSVEEKHHLFYAAIAASMTTTLVVTGSPDSMFSSMEREFGRVKAGVGLVEKVPFRIEPVTVAGYETAARLMGRIGTSFGLILFDEYLQMEALSRREAGLFSAAAKRLGVTTVPEPLGSVKPLADRLIGPMVFSSLGIPPRAPTPPRGEKIDLSSPIGPRALSKRLSDILSMHRPQRTLIVTDSFERALRISLRFLIPFLSHETGFEERSTVIRGFRRGRYRALVMDRMPTRPWEIPDLKALVLVGLGFDTPKTESRLDAFLEGSRAANVRVFTLPTSAELP